MNRLHAILDPATPTRSVFKLILDMPLFFFSRVGQRLRTFIRSSPLKRTKEQLVGQFLPRDKLKQVAPLHALFASVNTVTSGM